MRTHYCGHLTSLHIGNNVKLCGWVDKFRNLGNLIFIDMRDYTGTIQVLFDSRHPEALKNANILRNEFCIQIIGIVLSRKQINKKKKNGDIEILSNKLNIINYSDPLPLDFTKNNSDESRLKYRYLDLRRIKMQNNLKMRSKITNFIRNFMEDNNFINIETPFLTKSTPEGARDYLVPSRLNKGKFYALPQSPQIFKQLLMISGFDRYYQIVKCFRDEDLRTDRQPEFTQLDMEMSFVNAFKIRNIIESLIQKIWLKFKNIELGVFPIMTFDNAIKYYGTDKPDLRNALEIIDISNLLKYITDNSIFNNCINKKENFTLIKVPNVYDLNNKKIFECFNFINSKKLKVLFFVQNKTNNCLFNIKNNLFKKIYQETIKKFSIQQNDILFFIYGDKNKLKNIFYELSKKIKNNLKNNKYYKQYAPLWIVDFPMFEKNKNNIISSTHHPFTAPKNLTIDQIKKNPFNAISDSYDIIINGYEVGGGSVRINDINMQKAIFNILGISEKKQKEKFGFFLKSLKYGTPPHAGLAFGLDRLIMLITGSNNIKDVIAFPKTTSASCLMTQAPNIIENKTLTDILLDNTKNYN